jgi:Family of unknown function (DUF6958)
MTERILTLHPDPQKEGVNIDTGKYEVIKAAILEVVGAAPEVTFGDLTSAVRRLLGDTFPGSVSWYVTTVKLDLEARGLIERVPDKKPQHLRLKSFL